jgi:hypothetical protein
MNSIDNDRFDVGVYFHSNVDDQRRKIVLRCNSKDGRLLYLEEEQINSIIVRPGDSP